MAKHREATNGTPASPPDQLHDAQGVPVLLVLPPETRIYKLNHGIDCWFWLCEPCLAEKLTKGWALMEKRDAPHRLPCDECKWKRAKGEKR